MGKKKAAHFVQLFFRGDNQIRTGDRGVADLCLTTWLCRLKLLNYIIRKIPSQDIFSNDSNGNRTRVTAVKGRCLNRLTMEPYLSSLFSSYEKTPRVGLEPTTLRLTAECSTIELSRIKRYLFSQYLQNFIQISLKFPSLVKPSDD